MSKRKNGEKSNRELSAILRGAASALTHGRHKTAVRKVTQVLGEIAQPHLRLEGRLTPQECATVLHGLRLIQTGGRLEGCAAGDCEHFEDYEALTDAQIDILAERINLGWPTKTAPNATAFLELSGRREQSTVEADCGCLLDPTGDKGGAAFYQCETHEQAHTTKRHLSAVMDVMDELAEFLKEAHQLEIDDDHGGDTGAGCSYCDAIVRADEAKLEALGMEPRAEGYCDHCRADRLGLCLCWRLRGPGAGDSGGSGPDGHGMAGGVLTRP